MSKNNLIVDSNILIYSYKPEFAWLQQQLFSYRLYASAITKIESLGYHLLTDKDDQILIKLFDLFEILPINDKVIEIAVELRQQKKMSLGDSIIASTALVYDLPLMTRNNKDFEWVNGLEIINPFDESL